MSRILTPAEAASDGSAELFELVRQRIAAPGGLYFFCKFILGYVDLSERCHLPLCAYLEDESITHKLVEFPRKHLKTTIVTIGHTLWWFARAAILGQDPSKRFAILSSTKTNAQRFLRGIKAHPESNQIFQNFLPELLPEFSNEEVWNTDEIVFPRKVRSPEPSVDTLGAGGRATSRHYDWAKEDDLINEENWDSPPAVKKAIEQHQLFENLMEDNTCPRYVCENSWSDQDLNTHIVENEESTTVFSVGASLGINWERSRGIPEHVARFCAQRWSDGESIWPERFNKKALSEIRARMSARIYNAQYENRPFDEEVVDFKQEWLRFYEWTTVKGVDGLPERAMRILPAPGTPMEVVKLRDLNVVAAVDPAISEKTDAARTAFVATGVDPQERIFILEAKANRKDPLMAIKDWVRQAVQWNCTSVGVEDVLFQKVLVKLVQDECLRQGVSSGIFRGLSPPRGKNKDARIRYLIGAVFENGQVYVHKSMLDFLDEYTRFPIGKTKDLLDAFAYTAMLWRPGQTEEDERWEQQREEESLRQRDPLTGY